MFILTKGCIIAVLMTALYCIFHVFFNLSFSSIVSGCVHFAADEMKSCLDQSDLALPVTTQTQTNAMKCSGCRLIPQYSIICINTFVWWFHKVIDSACTACA